VQSEWPPIAARLGDSGHVVDHFADGFQNGQQLLRNSGRGICVVRTDGRPVGGCQLNR